MAADCRLTRLGASPRLLTSQSLRKEAPAMSRRSVLLPLAIPLFALALAGCTREAPAPEPVRSVKVMTVGVTSYEGMHEYAAEVKPRIESRLGFRVAGKIVKR